MRHFNTTTDFINNHIRAGGYTANDIIKTLGYSTQGGDGGSRWKATGNVIAASQDPLTLNDIKLSDASGNEFELVVEESGIIDLNVLGGTSASFVNIADAAGLTFSQGLTSDVSVDVKAQDTIDTLVNTSGISAGEAFNVKERSTDNGGGGLWDAVVTGTTPGVDLPNTFDIVIGVADPLISFVVRNENGIADMAQWGLVGDGSTVNTTAFAAIYPLVKALGLSTYFPEGTFKGKFTFDGGSQVNCAGMKLTLFTPSETDWCVRIFGESADALGATLRDCSITGGGGAGIGLEVGDSGAASSASNLLLERMQIDGFSTNWNMVACIMGTFNDVYSFSATLEAINFGSERNVTTCIFNTCRFRLSDTGVFARAGHVITWNNCNVESNRVNGLRAITGTTSGPTKWVWNGCWIEDNGGTPGGAAASTIASVVLDMQSGISTTKPTDMLFNRCICTSVSGAFDVSAVRAQDVIFDHCAFSTVANNGFSATKFDFNTGTNSVRVTLIQCGTIQEIATETMYASFPALNRASNIDYGFFYEFKDIANKTFSNTDLSVKGFLVITADATNLDVAGIRTLVVESVAGGFNINSLANGINGQTIRIIKPTSANTVVMVHNGSGSDKIFTKIAADVSLTTRTGSVITHYNGTWYQSDV